RVAAALAGALAMAVAVVPVWRSLHKLGFTLASAHTLPVQRPTAIAFDGASLWVAEWNGTLTAFDPNDPAQPLKQVPIEISKPFHPAAVGIWGDKMYTLDAAQGRILRQSLDRPEKVEDAWPTPGPAPVALAHDGRNLWSYDAATRLLYKHLGEGSESQVEAFKVGMDAVLTTMRWYKGELWAWDAKGKQIVVLKRSGNEFDPVQSAPLPVGVASLLLTVRADPKAEGTQHLEMWALTTGADGSTSLSKYLVGR
ncbi:MAG: hypothetical protein KGL53_07290, partial [Elusimicrobia bacterium]|nr:hypothetical protein [Elusimicrobiota bacterium]